MEKVKNTIIIILGLLLGVLWYLVYVADKLITVFSTQPKVGFNRFLNNPTLKRINPNWMGGEEVEHNLHTLALVRIIFVLFVYLLIQWIW